SQFAPYRAAGEHAGGVSERVQVPLASDVAHATDAVAVQQLRVEDLEVEAERVDAERVRPIDPAVGPRRMDLDGHQGVEVLADALHVGAEKSEADVPGVEHVAVHVAGIAPTLVH